MDRNGLGNNYRNSSSSSASSGSSSQYNSSSSRRNWDITYTSQPSSASMTRSEPLTQHDELIRYIREAWTRVSEQGTPVIPHGEPDHQLQNFKPFNLEEFWGRRLVQNIHVSHGQQ